jgi:hypothetical protein
MLTQFDSETTSTLTTVDSTVVLTSETTSTVLAESTVTITNTPTKRTPVPVVAPPVCVTKGTSYEPSMLSSACSCLSVTPSTTYVTATGSPSTDVIVSCVRPASLVPAPQHKQL